MFYEIIMSKKIDFNKKRQINKYLEKKLRTIIKLNKSIIIQNVLTLKLKIYSVHARD